MEYSFWKLKTNPVRIVKYRFDPINSYGAIRYFGGALARYILRP